MVRLVLVQQNSTGGIANNGLGNKMLTTAVAFLYALLRNRVLLDFFLTLEKTCLTSSLQKNKPTVTTPSNPKLKSILITCLVSEYYGKMRNKYWEYPTVTADIIAVSSQAMKSIKRQMMKCMTEKPWQKYFCSVFSYVLVTSAKSTFGHGLLVPHVRHCEDFSWGLQLVDI
ncbi:hypothetical protein M0R45_022221 [Rubus argutus]|uniref:Fucosyltransferase n=1 Tax=Rubus argutus TaxID=59490 RepID=A0AAW1XEW5_RUBAR